MVLHSPIEAMPAAHTGLTLWSAARPSRTVTPTGLSCTPRAEQLDATAVQESQRQARLASCLATPGMTGQERSTGELFNSAVRRLAVASDINTQLRWARPPVCNALPAHVPAAIPAVRGQTYPSFLACCGIWSHMLLSLISSHNPMAVLLLAVCGTQPFAAYPHIRICLRRYAEELRLRETESRLEDELGSPSCATLDATAVRARRCDHAA